MELIEIAYKKPKPQVIKYRIKTECDKCLGLGLTHHNSPYKCDKCNGAGKFVRFYDYDGETIHGTY